MPAAAHVHAGMTWLLGSHKNSLTELIRSNRKVSEKFGSFLLEKKNAKHGMAAGVTQKTL